VVRLARVLVEERRGRGFDELAVLGGVDQCLAVGVLDLEISGTPVLEVEDVVEEGVDRRLVGLYGDASCNGDDALSRRLTIVILRVLPERVGGTEREWRVRRELGGNGRVVANGDAGAERNADFLSGGRPLWGRSTRFGVDEDVEIATALAKRSRRDRGRRDGGEEEGSTHWSTGRDIQTMSGVSHRGCSRLQEVSVLLLIAWERCLAGLVKNGFVVIHINDAGAADNIVGGRHVCC